MKRPWKQSGQPRGHIAKPLAIAAMLGAAVAAGCSSDLKVAAESYRGPGLSHDTLNDAYLVVAQTPGAGWAIEIDATRKAADRTDVYLTLRRPNPIGAYAAVPVEQRILTRAGTDRPLRILARVVNHASTEERAYRRVRE